MWLVVTCWGKMSGTTTSQNSEFARVRLGDYEAIYDVLIAHPPDEGFLALVTSETLVGYIGSPTSRAEVVTLVLHTCVDTMLMIDYQACMIEVVKVLLERRWDNESEWLLVYKLFTALGASCPFSDRDPTGDRVLAMVGKKPTETSVAILGFFCDSLQYVADERKSILFLNICNSLGIRLVDVRAMLGRGSFYAVLESAIRDNKARVVGMLLFTNVCINFEEEYNNALALAEQLGNTEVIAYLRSFPWQGQTGRAVHISYRLPGIEHVFNANTVLSIMETNKKSDYTEKVVERLQQLLGPTLGLRLLEQAFRNKDERDIELALEFGPNLNAVYVDNKGLLYEYLRTNSDWAVAKLIDLGANPFSDVNKYESPNQNNVDMLFQAMRAGSLSSFVIVLQNLNNRQRILMDTVQDQKTLLDYAIETRNLNFVKLIVRAGANITKPNHPALNTAITMGDPLIVQYLIGAGASPEQKDYNGNTALHAAVLAQNIGMVRFLMSIGGPAMLQVQNRDRMRPGDVAVNTTDDFFRMFLREVGPTILIPKDSISPMFSYIDRGNIEMVTMLFGVINQVMTLTQFSGYGFLNYAIREQQDEIAAFFRSQHVTRAENPVFAAIYTTYVTNEMITMLRSRLRPDTGMQPVFDLGKRIIEQGREGDRDLLIMLFDMYGIPIESRDARGRSLLDIAIDARRPELINLCETYGFQPPRETLRAERDYYPNATFTSAGGVGPRSTNTTVVYAGAAAAAAASGTSGRSRSPRAQTTSTSGAHRETYVPQDIHSRTTTQQPARPRGTSPIHRVADMPQDVAAALSGPRRRDPQPSLSMQDREVAERIQRIRMRAEARSAQEREARERANGRRG